MVILGNECGQFKHHPAQMAINSSRRGGGFRLLVATMEKSNLRQNTFWAACPRYLEAALAREIQSLKINSTRNRWAGVEFTCPNERVFDVFFSTRVASRLYKRLYTIHFDDWQDLTIQLQALDWVALLAVQQTFKITTHFDQQAQSHFKNSLFFSQKLKDALVDGYRQQQGQRPSVDLHHPDLNFMVRVETNQQEKTWFLSWWVDLSGNSLSHRGYRLPDHPAPLRENLAAGILLLTDFRPQKDVFIDSMCGTGTLLVEAAWIAGNVSPRFLELESYLQQGQKPWSLLQQRWFLQNPSLRRCFKHKAEKYYQTALAGLEKLPSEQFFGFEQQREYVGLTKKTCERCHLANVVTLLQTDATTQGPPAAAPGIILCNPPFGERMNPADLHALYHAYGENLKKQYTNFRAYIFAANLELPKRISLHPSARIPLMSGPLEARLYKYELY